MAAPQLWLARLGQGVLVGLILAYGGTVVLRRATTTITRALGATMLAASVLSLASAVLLGPALWGNRSGMEAFESFVFVLAWAGLAYGYGELGHSPFPEEDAYPRAKAAADRALELDPGHDLAIYLRGLVAGTRGQAEQARIGQLPTVVVFARTLAQRLSVGQVI